VAEVRKLVEAVGEGRVGVIAPRTRTADLQSALAGLLADPEGGPDAVLDARVAVLALDEAKGLEFDAVVVVEPAELVDDHPDGLRALYVALTRTTRWLTIAGRSIDQMMSS